MHPCTSTTKNNKLHSHKQTLQIEDKQPTLKLLRCATLLAVYPVTRTLYTEPLSAIPKPLIRATRDGVQGRLNPRHLKAELQRYCMRAFSWLLTLLFLVGCK
ncbi:MAG: hypothetical protein L7U83_15020, partial [Akkermansiaceae bacterium]|nr:hypothetical protein [Akkermansiaceae bacterium]